MRLLSRTSSKASEVVFGTNRGIFSYLTESSRLPTTYSDESARLLAANGYIQLPTTKGRELNEFYSFFKQNLDLIGRCFANTEEGKQLNFNKSIENVQQHYPRVDALLSQETTSLIRAFYGRDFRINRVTAWRNFHVPPQYQRVERFSNYYHLDNDPLGMLKIFFYLSDVDSDCGPFHMLDRPTSRRMLRKSFTYRKKQTPEYISSIDHFALKMTGDSGTTFICRTPVCVHRAGIPSEGRQRDIVQFEIFPEP